MLIGILKLMPQLIINSIKVSFIDFVKFLIIKAFKNEILTLKINYLKLKIIYLEN